MDANGDRLAELMEDLERAEALLRTRGAAEPAEQLGKGRSQILACVDLLDRIGQAQTQARVDGDAWAADHLARDIERLTSRDGYGFRRLLFTLELMSSDYDADEDLSRVLRQAHAAASLLLGQA